MKTQHQGVRERPVLTAKITKIGHFQIDLLLHLTVQTVLSRFARLDKASQRTEEARRKVRRTRQQNLITLSDQNDNTGRNFRILTTLAGQALHCALVAAQLHGLATTTAELMRTVPGIQLLRKTQQLK